MARKKLTVKAYIDVDGETVPLFLIDENGEAKFFLPEDKRKEYETRMLKNIAEAEKRYVSAHQNSNLV